MSSTLGLAISGLAGIPAPSAELNIGQPAPDFPGTDSCGQTLRLSDLEGKPVVLEWTNDGCPCVRKWYSSGAMQKLQHEAAASGAIRLTIVSSAPGEQGYVDATPANALRCRPMCCSICKTRSAISMEPRPRRIFS